MSSSETKAFRDVDNHVLNALAQGKLLKTSVMREGSRAFFALRTTSRDGRQPEDLHLQVSCGKGEATAALLFIDFDDGSGRVARSRYYGSKSSVFSSPVKLKTQTAQALGKIPLIVKACKRDAQWREVVYSKRDDTQVILDISSLKTRANGSVRFWGAVDYPYMAYIRLYNAPYARRTGLYQVDCRRRTFSVLYVYFQDGNQTVTDGGLTVRPSVLGIDQATGDYAPVLTMVCDQHNALESLMPVVPRKKTFPELSAAPEADARVVEVLARLKLIRPQKDLRVLRVEGTRAQRGQRPLHGVKLGFFVRDVRLEPQRTPGVFRVSISEGHDAEEHISFLGLFSLSHMVSNPVTKSTAVADRLDLNGDWDTMPMGANLSWRLRRKVVDIVTGQTRREENVICQVTRQVAAQGLNPDFSGNARELTCHVVEDKDNVSLTYYYLEDYGFALQQGLISNRLSMDAHVAYFR